MSNVATFEETNIGWIGTGVMGTGMCRNLINAGYSVTVYSRTKEKSQSLIELGARWADTPREVAEQSDITFSIVGMPSDVRQIALDSQTGVLSGCKDGDIFVDMTTSEPKLAIEIAKAAATVNVVAIDAPVSGGDIGARSGELSIMVGGDADAVSFVQPCFEVMGKTIVHQGGPGAGQHTKMMNQILVAAGMVGVCESLLYASRAGLDLEIALKSVSSGAAGSWALSNLGPRIVKNDFEPGFFVDHFVKDLGIAVTEAEKAGLKLPGLSLARELYLQVQADGDGDLGTQALQNALAKMSGLSWPA
jgi:3-hydroxyisobutyrate dehydrogenase